MFHTVEQPEAVLLSPYHRIYNELEINFELVYFDSR